MVKGNLIIYRFIVVLRWTTFSDPAHQKTKPGIFYVWVYARVVSQCASLCTKVPNACMCVCECVSA